MKPRVIHKAEELSILQALSLGATVRKPSRILRATLWVLFVAAAILVVCVAPIASWWQIGIAIGCFLGGALFGRYLSAEAAYSRWPVIAPHIDRASVAARITQLGA